MLRFESEPACPSKLLIARCYSTIRARIRPNGFERILAHRIGCQRATASLSSRVASKQLCNYSEAGSECQHLETKKVGISTEAPISACKCFIASEIRRAKFAQLATGSRFSSRWMFLLAEVSWKRTKANLRSATINPTLIAKPANADSIAGSKFSGFEEQRGKVQPASSGMKRQSEATARTKELKWYSYF